MSWIKVSERLPKEGQQVFTYFGESMAFAIFYNGKFFEGELFTDNEFTVNVTHWMPLPEKPKED